MSPPRTIVTGGTRGIGAAIARRLAADGHDVVALGRRLPQVAPPPGVRFDAAEATDPVAVASALARADADGRGLTGLVVSAGIWEPSSLGGEPEAVSAEFRRIFEVNVLGAVHAVAAFVRHARTSGDVSIVLVGSTAGQRGESGYAAYSASKSALHGLAKSWAVELAPRGIRVNVASPGWVDTDMTAGTLGDARTRERIEAGIPRGRVASADDIAGPVAFLLSPDSRHVTGTILSINGGAVLGSA